MEVHEQTIHISAGTIIKTVVVLFLCAVLFVLKDLLLVLLMSVVIASSVEPAAQWLMRRKFPRLLSVLTIYLSMAMVLVASIFFLLIPLLSESVSFLHNFPTYFNSNAISTSISNNQFLASQPFVEGLKNSINFDQVTAQLSSFIASISSSTFSTFATIFGGILSFVLIVVLSFYLSVEEDGVGKFLKIVTPLKHEKYIINLWRRSQKKIGAWMQGQLILAVIIGMLVYLGLLLLGVQNALLLAVLAAICEIIPLFGPILASIPAITITFVSGGLSSALVVAGLYIIVHQFENQLIYPLVVKKVVGVNPVVSIIALVAGWQLAGFLGLVLSVPIAAVMIEFFEDLERDKIEKIERMGNNQ
ncbi:MAG: AI-2E family transporter [bacterium]